MGKNSRQEAEFLRGDVGADGLAIEEEVKDEAEVERGAAVEALARNRAYLGREFLTWLLWKSHTGEPLLEHEGEPVTVLLVGRVILRGLAGEATELAVRGHTSAYSKVVRFAIQEGLLVHAARLRIQHGEQVFEVTVDAEHLDFRSAAIPAVLSEEEDDKLSERLWLTEKLGALVEALWASFLEVRGAKTWKSREVAALKKWLEEFGEE